MPTKRRSPLPSPSAVWHCLLMSARLHSACSAGLKLCAAAAPAQHAPGTAPSSEAPPRAARGRRRAGAGQPPSLPPVGCSSKKVASRCELSSSFLSSLARASLITFLVMERATSSARYRSPSTAVRVSRGCARRPAPLPRLRPAPPPSPSESESESEPASACAAPAAAAAPACPAALAASASASAGPPAGAGCSIAANSAAKAASEGASSVTAVPDWPARPVRPTR